ncbi:hypothetical protein P0Y35_15250 [Kiritimatiellaeota bacterium B1221]|nr:hypothetical protein [Kiritimatiellaeota bacterium B1221]
MKKMLMGALAGGLSLMVFSQEVDPKQRAKQSLALRAAAQEVVLLLNQQSRWSPEDRLQLTEELSEEILENLKTYRQKALGKTAARTWVTAWRVYDYDLKVGEVMGAAQSQSPLPISIKDILKRVGPDWQVRCERGAKLFAENAVDLVYPQARERAVDELKKRMEAGLQYPTQAEVDEWLLGLDNEEEDGSTPLTQQAFQSLTDLIQPQVVPFETLLEEVSQEPARLTQKVLEVLWLQYQEQMNRVVEVLRPGMGEGGMWMADDMKRAINEGWETVAAAKPDARPPVYDVFKVVSLWGERAAADWEEAELVNFLQSWEEGKVTGRMLENIINVKPSAHLRPEESAEVLKEAVMEIREEQLVDTWMANAPAARKEALRAYYSEALTGEGHLVAAWEAEIDKNLNQQLPAIRQAFAEKQLKAFYPGLANDEPLPESVILWFYDRELAEARESAQVRQAFEMEEDPDAVVFSETGSLAVEVLNEELKPGLQSLTAQIQLIREMEKEGMEVLKASVAKGLDADVLYDQWLKVWQQRWQGIKETQDPRWQEMMRRTSDEMRKTVRQWYVSVEENLAEVKEVVSKNPPEMQTADVEAPNSPEMTPVEVPLEPVSEPKGVEEEAPASDVGDVEDAPKPDAGITEELENFRGKADGVLAFSDLGNGDCRLLFGSPDGKGALSVGFDPENVEASAQKIAEALSGPLRDVLNGTASANEKGGFRLFTRAKEPTLSMLFQVDSPKIRHQMSIQVRQLIQQEIDLWAEEKGQQAPVLLWQDEMGLWTE